MLAGGVFKQKGNTKFVTSESTLGGTSFDRNRGRRIPLPNHTVDKKTRQEARFNTACDVDTHNI
ncbi:hypothetical protein M413DRAFT_450115 [Hebeloma cylindrosporum]|uniref:Uncharacterized protein n=1 Tax=Hebeloma cylindrosporum TaxID=76867 RepID=A0A0C2Y0R2_HEBCY|nr:hypothetical protein M413DRAFT_450115 [Hebeloma cylindrosporum h7]